MKYLLAFLLNYKDKPEKFSSILNYAESKGRCRVLILYSQKTMSDLFCYCKRFVTVKAKFKKPITVITHHDKYNGLS